MARKKKGPVLPPEISPEALKLAYVRALEGDTKGVCHALLADELRRQGRYEAKDSIEWEGVGIQRGEFLFRLLGLLRDYEAPATGVDDGLVEQWISLKD